uniref:SRPBCC family protein n=1 Tax=Pararhizobium sp. IMCC3301 TaxID=3067904 RepID=UPI00274242E7|nr:carbon monoxide dehydrogenase subunit G [Pararhizobium sp. IMCC3301]
MDMSGEYRIPAPRETVWAALNDPEILKQCIPGCESLEMTSDTEMTAAVTTKVGPVKAKFKGSVTLSDIDPPKGYRISGEGKGGVAGFAKGGAEVNLEEDGTDTILRYTATAQVGGKLAQLGSRLIDSTAKKMADEFFGNFSAKLGAGTEAAPVKPVVETASISPAAETVSVSQAAEIPAPAVKKTTDKATIDDRDLGHDDNISDVAREIGEAVHDAEETLEVEAGKGTLGGPMMWGFIALAILIAGLLLLS